MPFSNEDNKRLNELLKITEERPCPMNDWEVQFLESLDGQRQYALSEKQQVVFDRLVERHLGR